MRWRSGAPGGLLSSDVQTRQEIMNVFDLLGIATPTFLLPGSFAAAAHDSNLKISFKDIKYDSAN
eukprot:764140-Hanusia_phi.AAC.3